MSYTTRSEAEGRDLGATLNRMGVVADLDDDEHVLDAVVLLRVASSADGMGVTRLVIAASTTCDAIVQSGLINQARAVVDNVVPEDDA